MFRGVLDGPRVRITRRWRFDGAVGAAVTSADGWLLVAEETSLTLIDPAGMRHPGARIVLPGKPSRTNDASCDPQGRLVIGTSSTAPAGGSGADEALVRVATDGSIETIDPRLGLSNGIAWSPDGRRMYHVDTATGVIWTRDYPARGAPGPRSELLRIDDALPDGICVDEHGDIWVALWGGAAVRCYRPDGELLAVVEVPAPNTTSAAFVGPVRDRLLITTAAADPGADDPGAFPDSGRLFLADVGVRGAPVAPWRRTGQSTSPPSTMKTPPVE